MYSLNLTFADGSQLLTDLDYWTNCLPNTRRWLKEHGTPTNVDIVYMDDHEPNEKMGRTVSIKDKLPLGL